MKITSKTRIGYLHIYFDGILHLKVKVEDINGVQSWIDNGWYYIEFYVNRQEILLGYDTADKWKIVLKIIDSL